MDQDAIIRYIEETFTGLDMVRPSDGLAAGDTFFSYDPDRDLDPAHRLPFSTIVTKDYGEFDNASQLDRPGVYRLNIGVGRDAFRSLFGYAPGEEAPHTVTYDYAALDHVPSMFPRPASFAPLPPLVYAEVVGGDEALDQAAAGDGDETCGGLTAQHEAVRGQ